MRPRLAAIEHAVSRLLSERDAGCSKLVLSKDWDVHGFPQLFPESAPSPAQDISPPNRFSSSRSHFMVPILMASRSGCGCVSIDMKPSS